MPEIGSREGIVRDFDFTSKKAGQRMQTICNLVSYAEKRVQVIPVDFPQGEAAAWEETRGAVCVCFFWTGLGTILLGGYMENVVQGLQIPANSPAPGYMEELSQCSCLVFFWLW